MRGDSLSGWDYPPPHNPEPWWLRWAALAAMLGLAWAVLEVLAWVGRQHGH